MRNAVLAWGFATKALDDAGMSRFLLSCVAVCGLLAAAASAPAQDGEGKDIGAAFTVSGIEIDVGAPTSDAARDAAFKEAPRRAWPRLWARLTGNEADSAPQMSDAALSAIIDGIEIQREQLGEGRYIATLGVAFDRQRAGRRLPAGARVIQSRPMLLVPVLTEAGAMSTYEPYSPWFKAWQAFPASSSTIDYVRPRGSAADRVIVNGWQGLRGDRRLWRQILGRYSADNVVTAEARLRRTYPGGPVSGYFLARYGPDAEILDSFSLRASSSAEIPAMLSQAVQRMDGAYTRALEEGVLQAEDSLSANLSSISAPPVEIDDGFEALGLIIAQVPTPAADDWVALENAISGVPAVDRLTLTSLQVGGLSEVELATSASEAQLRAALAARNLTLVGSDGNYIIRRRQTGDGAAGEVVTPNAAGTGGAGISEPQAGSPAQNGQPPAGNAPAAPSTNPSATGEQPQSLLPPVDETGDDR